MKRRAAPSLVFQREEIVKRLLLTTSGILCMIVGTLPVAATSRYVSLSGLNTPPYTNWVDAATNLQAAVDASVPGDTLWVTNGTYETGGRAFTSGATSNRVMITEGVTVRSVKGPGVTIIRGMGPRGPSAVRCAYLGTNAQLIGFTLSDGGTQTSTDTYGGGVWCEDGAVVSNCVLSSNSAYRGGGAYQGRLSDCVINNNSAQAWGGGTYESDCWNCEICSNTASSYGGGATLGTIEDSVVRNNSSMVGGGTSFANLLNSIIMSNTAGHSGGGVNGGTSLGCQIIANVAADYSGGGAFEGTFSNCVFIDNSARDGGGAHSATLTKCRLERNAATYSGGGAANSHLIECMIVSNNASLGAGASGCDLNTCAVASNTSFNRCGGVMGGTADNCLITGNTATSGAHQSEGGASDAILRHCTVVSNVGGSFGGVYGGTALNCIVYYNTDSTGSSNVSNAACSYTCTTPDPGGVGNVTNAPLFASAGDFHLLSISPCIDAGTNLTDVAGDLDGLPRPLDGNADGIARSDMGAYEFVHATADTDQDGMADANELIADTDLLDANSLLRFTAITSSNGIVVVQWKGGQRARQYLQYKQDLASAMEEWQTIYTNEPVTPIMNQYADACATNATRIYRIRVE